MSAATVLYCDDPSCTALRVEPTTTSWIARLRAVDEDCWHSSDLGDYCPAHALRVPEEAHS